MSTLFVVATPIGNLEDISARALRILNEVDLILAEDTRVSRNLLTHFGIKTPMISYHQHSKLNKINEIIAKLKQGCSLALISDAGTPSISDPGNFLVEKVIESLGSLVKIEPIPGASAVTAIASVCGFAMDRFLFLGFPPQKRKRRQFFEELAKSKYPVVFYESPYRIIKSLKEMGEFDKKSSPFEIVVGRELTKKFETIYRGNLSEVTEAIKNTPIKGEFVVAVKPQ
ncbi:MAG: 16S rRNA (cytidine(1402)-2'-O)-methyltransferase [Candidatus Gribaldobacteria bacterium]|nr:16S rRNA (cytidine(1402)-2'-O)-methyltransferase [Candidatus Gribaldobacteria bacterium]